MRFFTQLSIVIIILASSFCFAVQDSKDYLNIAAVFKETIEYQKAIDVLERSRAAGFDERRDKYLATLYYLTDNPRKALDILDGITEKDWLTFLYLGLVYEDLGKKDKAKGAYLKALALKDNSIALYRLAKIYYNEKAYPRAGQFFSRLIELDASIRLAYYYLGDCFLEDSDFESAYNYFSKAVKFYPQNKELAKKLEFAKKKILL